MKNILGLRLFRNSYKLSRYNHNMGKNDEIEKIKSKIIPILKKHKVTKAGIFGSYARGEQKKKSDVDILIQIGNESGLIEVIKLKNTIQKAINKEIDIVEYENIRHEIKDSILRDEIIILK